MVSNVLYLQLSRGFSGVSIKMLCYGAMELKIDVRMYYEKYSLRNYKSENNAISWPFHLKYQSWRSRFKIFQSYGVSPFLISTKFSERSCIPFSVNVQATIHRESPFIFHFTEKDFFIIFILISHKKLIFILLILYFQMVYEDISRIRSHVKIFVNICEVDPAHQFSGWKLCFVCAEKHELLFIPYGFQDISESIKWACPALFVNYSMAENLRAMKFCRWNFPIDFPENLEWTIKLYENFSFLGEKFVLPCTLNIFTRIPNEVAMVWREPKNHFSNCYFWPVNKKSIIPNNRHTYPNLNSAIRPI